MKKFSVLGFILGWWLAQAMIYLVGGNPNISESSAVTIALLAVGLYKGREVSWI